MPYYCSQSNFIKERITGDVVERVLHVFESDITICRPENEVIKEGLVCRLYIHEVGGKKVDMNHRLTTKLTTTNCYRVGSRRQFDTIPFESENFKRINRRDNIGMPNLSKLVLIPWPEKLLTKARSEKGSFHIKVPCCAFWRSATVTNISSSSSRISNNFT